MTLLLITGLLVSNANAQEYSHSLNNDPNNVIEFALSHGNLRIEAYAGDEVMIRNNNYETPPERADGLRSLYGGGIDNTGVGLTVEEDGSTLRILPVQSRRGDFVMRIPDRVRVMVEQVNWGDGDIELVDHRGDIEIAGKNGDIVLKNITGPIIASTTSGNIEIEISELNGNRPTSISNVSGYIDITLPASAMTTFHMSSISGGIYTDMDLEVSGDRNELSRLGGGDSINGNLNGGGVEVELKAISGDIYLRSR